MSRLIAPLGIAAFFLGILLIVQQGSLPAPTYPSVPPSPASASADASATLRAHPPIPVGYRVQIPRLGIDLAILEGDIERDTVQYRTPDGYAFHLPGTAIPGTGANAYLYAHARPGMFLALWNVKAGDVVWISTPDGRALRYVVSEVHPRVPPSDTSWAAPSPPERLTLQTSTGPADTDPRFVVVAHPG
ncbi:MAG TPA: sortase [Candidatus Limnocylindria bacterium]|nr:sortase [Candidatus Limnocylindria bacterium]